jgi:hypothetical protein
MQVFRGSLTIPISNEKYQLNHIGWRVREISVYDTFRKFCYVDMASQDSVKITPLMLTA